MRIACMRSPHAGHRETMCARQAAQGSAHARGARAPPSAARTRAGSVRASCTRRPAARAPAARAWPARRRATCRTCATPRGPPCAARPAMRMRGVKHLQRQKHRGCERQPSLSRTPNHSLSSTAEPVAATHDAQCYPMPHGPPFPGTPSGRMRMVRYCPAARAQRA